MDSAESPADADAPVIERRAGGWFVLNEPPQDWSGPWFTERAAELARAGDYKAAHDEERRHGR